MNRMNRMNELNYSNSIVNFLIQDPNTPPLQTASVSIRALIEEKIIQRRNMAAAGGSAGGCAGSGLGGLGGSDAEQVSPSSGCGQQDSAAAHLGGCESLLDASPVDPSGASGAVANGAADHPAIPKIEPETYFEGI